MAIKKDAGGIEDLTLGMGTIQQMRKGQVATITQINGSYIPYSDTESINQKVDRLESKVDPIRTDLDNHKNRTDNPHNITTDDIGAAPKIHEHVIADVFDLQGTLDTKLEYGDISNLIKSDPTVQGVGHRIYNIISVTQTEYDSITPRNGTLYIITGA